MTALEILPITPADDALHPVGTHPYETETFWVSFSVPERAMGGWFYNQLLANQGVCHGGAWVWDDTAAPARYEVFHRDLPIDVAAVDLRDVVLPNGNHLQALAPLERYRVRYRDPGRFEADLTFEALRPPHSHPLGVAPFWKGRHFDQPMRATGEIVLDGERIAVDSLSVRDRSWGPRPGPRKERPGGAAAAAPPPPDPDAVPPASPFGVGYVFGTASADDLFLAYTLPGIHRGVGADPVTTGYLVRDGVYGRLVEGHRRAEVDGHTGWMTGIELEALDEHGRSLTATGRLVSHHGAEGLGTGLFRWSWDGAEGYGEDQSMAPPVVLDALLAAGVWRTVG